MKNRIKIWNSWYKEISEEEWGNTTETEEKEECLCLIDWDGEPIAYFKLEKLIK